MPEHTKKRALSALCCRLRLQQDFLVPSRHYKCGEHEPVSPLIVVTSLSNRISRGQAFNAPLFGHNVPATPHNEGPRCHCRCLIATAHTDTQILIRVRQTGASLPNANTR